mmetsp:Transcript_118238/g.331141  ORF Transcript_118238/g.331141 Transcript_118238/m.331141 type:complete len:204 (+) Transcript_118238:757-1368(+)
MPPKDVARSRNARCESSTPANRFMHSARSPTDISPGLCRTYVASTDAGPKMTSPSCSTPAPSTWKDACAHSSLPIGWPSLATSPEVDSAKTPQRMKLWPFLFVSNVRCSFRRKAATMPGHAAATDIAASRASPETQESRDSAILGTSTKRLLQRLSTARAFMFRSPASTTALPLARSRCIAARSARRKRNLKGSREPPEEFGT